MLSKRLSVALSYISDEDIVADIGADHGYLAKAMLDMGVKHIQIVENKTEPLKRAQSTLCSYQNVSYSLSDGLNDLEPSVDTVTICGMGGLNIVEIINNNLNKAQKLKKLVLQANSKVSDLRVYLTERGFSIYDEDVILDKNQYYDLIVCKYTGNANLNDAEIYFGPINLKKMSQSFIDKYLRQLDILNNVITKLDNQSSPDYQNINKKIELIKHYIIGE